MIHTPPSGFAALISVTAIATFLLAAVASASYTGFYARSSMLAYERREAARAYTDACIEALRLRLLYEPTYRGDDRFLLSEGVECVVEAIEAEGSGSSRTYTTSVTARFMSQKYVSYMIHISSVAIELDAETLDTVSKREIPNGE